MLALALAGAPRTAAAGALNRPNIYSPLGIGIGGAGFAGVANPTTIHYNPAGMILMARTNVLGGVELVLAPRSHTPSGADEEAARLIPVPVPSLGICTRFAARGGRDPLPVAFGLGFYNTFGGALSFDEDRVQPGITDATLLVLELVPAFAYQVTSRLALGVALRFGFGVFSMTNNETRGVERLPATVSGSGIQVGATLGAVYAPTGWLRLGLVYGSPLSMTMNGEGDVDAADMSFADNVEVKLPWPQWAALGATVQLGPSGQLSVGLRWTDYSSFKRLQVELRQAPDLIEPLDFRDGVSVHLGTRWSVHPRLTLMGGLSYDSNTIPDERMQRAFFDAHKLSLSAGASVRVWGSFLIDSAFEAVVAPDRTVDAVAADGAANPSPGTYSLGNYTLALGLRYLY